jgi:hypothetical protein
LLYQLSYLTAVGRKGQNNPLPEKIQGTDWRSFGLVARVLL